MKWKVYGVIGLIVAGLLAVWLYDQRDDAVYERILHQEGYVLSMIKAGVPVDIELKPEWIPKKRETETELNLVIKKIGDDLVILEKVGRSRDRFWIQLNVKPHPDRRSGRTVSINHIEGGRFSSGGGIDEWELFSPDRQRIALPSFSSGGGPGNLAILEIDEAYLDQLQEGGIIRYLGLHLYGYRMLETDYMGFLFPFIIGFLLVVLWRISWSRTDQEEWLYPKLIGYMLLGGFTFILNSTKIPLGFIVYFLLFMKQSKANHKVKHTAALLGLLLFASQFITPGISKALNHFTYPSQIEHVNVRELSMEELSRLVLSQLPLDEGDKVSEYEGMMAIDGQFEELSIRFVDAKDHEYHHWKLDYNPEREWFNVEKHETEEWYQYSRQVSVFDFFRRIDIKEIREVKELKNQPYIEFSLRDSGATVNYAIKDTVKYKNDPAGVFHLITNDELPVEGYWFHACGKESRSSQQCAVRVDFLFE